MTQENNPDRVLHHPYQHPAIQKAINITWFRDSVDDGLVFKEHFSPLPVPAIAFILTVIECCIDEWRDGSRRETSWEEERFKTVYQSHINSLNEFRQPDDDLFEQLRSGLCKEAYKHAGVTPALVDRLRRFTLNPLDIAHERLYRGTSTQAWTQAPIFPCRLPGCQVPIPSDIATRHGGFCCDTHMWMAVHNGIATQCPRCQRVCPEGQRFCGASCANGR
jgi:hypothetical protein